LLRPPSSPSPSPYTALFRSSEAQVPFYIVALLLGIALVRPSVKFGFKELFEMMLDAGKSLGQIIAIIAGVGLILGGLSSTGVARSEEHTSELQSRFELVCRL